MTHIGYPSTQANLRGSCLLLPKDRSGTVPQIALKGGVIKAAANLGCIVGQIGFGILGDIYGRRRVWPAGLCVTIIGTVLIVSAPLSLGAKGVFTWITVWRVIMGIGIGGDYPMSSAAISDRSATARRGMLLAFTFSMQGWGNFLGGVITLVIIYCYKSSIQAEDLAKLNGVWRIITGIVLVPCIGTLYHRIILPESQKYKNARALQDNPDLLKKGLIASDTLPTQKQATNGHADNEKPPQVPSSTNSGNDVDIVPDNTAAEADAAETTGLGVHGATAAKKAAVREFIDYFKEPRHAILLFSTAANWFLLDIAFYGINLNQSIVLSSIGYNRTDTTWNFLHDNTVGNLIITAAGFLPGYYLSIVSIEYIGRKPIQLIGFFGTTLMLWVVAGTFHSLQHKSGAFIACFTLLQLLFNFGANTTTFIVASETHPTRVRGFASGFSAACGKVGAVIASLAFSVIQTKIGTAKIL